MKNLERLNLTLLKQARRSRGLSIDKVSSLIGKNRTMLWRYETGKSDIPVKVLLKILNTYKISVMDVFDRGSLEG